MLVFYMSWIVEQDNYNTYKSRDKLESGTKTLFDPIKVLLPSYYNKWGLSKRPASQFNEGGDFLMYLCKHCTTLADAEIKKN